MGLVEFAVVSKTEIVRFENEKSAAENFNGGNFILEFYFRSKPANALRFAQSKNSANAATTSASGKPSRFRKM